MRVFVFSSLNLANIQIGHRAGLWAVSEAQASSASLRGRARNLQGGAYGLLYCKETHSVTVPFEIQSTPDFESTITDIWPGSWKLPFHIRPLGPPSKSISKDDLVSILPGLARSGKSWHHVFHIQASTAFSASTIEDEDWAILISRLTDAGGVGRVEKVSGDIELEPYVPHDSDDRSFVNRQVADRRGQPAFRDALLRRYQGKCLVTGSRLEALLEAADVCPFRSEKDDHPANGLLLRADIHTLFDLDLIGIAPGTLRVHVHPDAADEYGQYEGEVLRCSGVARPSEEAIEKRFEQFCRRLGTGVPIHQEVTA